MEDLHVPSLRTSAKRLRAQGHVDHVVSYSTAWAELKERWLHVTGQIPLSKKIVTAKHK
jgi:hypothetical protein